jgi:hypothetical protein
MTPPDWNMRRFDPDIEGMARECYENPTIKSEFTANGGMQGGGTGSRQAIVRQTGRTAWIKPARAAADNQSCVANEKIASDLAYKLGLPVAPVQIILEHGQADFPAIVVASYAASAQPRPWPVGQLGHLNEDQRRSLAGPLGAMRVFHAWIDDHDHDWNAGNALLDVIDEQTVRPIFIDYSFSLTRQWMPPAPPPARNWNSRNGPYQNLDGPTALAAIDQINQLALNDIEAIIKRVPEAVLSGAAGDALASGLFERRANLKGLLGF